MSFGVVVRQYILDKVVKSNVCSTRTDLPFHTNNYSDHAYMKRNIVDCVLYFISLHFSKWTPIKYNSSHLPFILQYAHREIFLECDFSEFFEHCPASLCVDFSLGNYESSLFARRICVLGVLLSMKQPGLHVSLPVVLSDAICEWCFQFSDIVVIFALVVWNCFIEFDSFMNVSFAL